MTDEVLDEDSAVTKPFCWTDPEENDPVNFTITTTEDPNISLYVKYDSGLCAELDIMPIENFNGYTTATVTISGTADPYCSGPDYEDEFSCVENGFEQNEAEDFLSSQSFEIEILPVNDAPTWTGFPFPTIYWQGEPAYIDFSQVVFDVEGDSLFYNAEVSFPGEPGLVDINIEGDLISFDPGYNFVGIIGLTTWVFDEGWSIEYYVPDTTNISLEWVPLIANECAGDINDDDSVDVSDLVLMVDCILNDTDVCNCSDLDGNGSIDVGDIVLMVEMILGE